MTPVVEARRVAREFTLGETVVTAVAGVDLTISRGEFLAVMGPSGCGKSTLLNLLAGLDRPTSGEVWIDGERTDRKSERELALMRRSKIGVVFQSFNLLPALTAGQNVELPLRLARMRGRKARAIAGSFMADLGVLERRDSAPALLSGGEQQRVALARALASEPEIIFADEPTGNLDSDSTRDVVELLRTAHQRGQTLMVVTHDSRVAAAAQRVVTLRDGRIANQVELGPAGGGPRHVDLGVLP